VQHHVELLMKNSILEKTGGGYGEIYFISDLALTERGMIAGLKGGKHGKK